MLRQVGRRLATAIPILFVVSFLVFLLMDLSPRDPAVTLAGDNPTPERVEEIRRELKLDDPAPVRYGRWVQDAIQGDFGTSLTTRESVWHMISTRVGPTVSLALVALVFAVVIALVGGTLAALRPGGFADRFVNVLASVSLAMPSFWLGILLVLWFAISLPLLPAVGYEPLSAGPWTWLEHLILPGIALALGMAAELTLQLKTSLSDTLNRDYVLAAEARGLSRKRVVAKHAMKNAAVPLITVLGYRTAQLLGGAVIIEYVFYINGLGSLTIQSVLSGDIPVLLALVVLTTLVVITINLLVDVSYGYFNPKIRTHG